jgi:hypothetical protein
MYKFFVCNKIFFTHCLFVSSSLEVTFQISLIYDELKGM